MTCRNDGLVVTLRLIIVLRTTPFFFSRDLVKATPVILLFVSLGCRAIYLPNTTSLLSLRRPKSDSLAVLLRLCCELRGGRRRIVSSRSFPWDSRLVV